MISPLNAKLDRKWIEASQRIAELEAVVAALRSQMYADRKQALVWRDQADAMTKLWENEYRLRCEAQGSVVKDSLTTETAPQQMPLGDSEGKAK